MNYLRYAWRHACAQPSFSLIVILTVGLTVGAAASVFSLFDAALLRPFPYEAPDRLVSLQTHTAKDPASALTVSLYDFEDYRRRNRSFESMAAYLSFSNPLTGIGPAQSVYMTFASAGLFELIGVKPVVGRLYTREEDVVGGAVLKAVISYGIWQNLFNGQPDAIGKLIQLRGQSFEVLGVMPQGVSFPDRTQVWVPLMARYTAYKQDWWKRRDARVHLVIARLRDGVTIQQANSDVAAMAAVLRTEHPEQNLDADGRVISLRDAETGDAKPYIFLVAWAALLLLVLGCVNVANLMVARSVAREREVVVRRALGAGPWSLIWQLLAEALLLSLTGALLGIGMAYAGVRTFLSLLPVDVPSWMQLQLDWKVLGFGMAAAIVTAVLAMMLPAFQQLNTNVNGVLKQSGRGSSEGHGFATWIRRGLVVSEIALSLVLLTGAALMVRSFQKAMSTDQGLRAEHLIVVESGRYVANVDKESAVRAYCDEYRKVQLALEETPGVASASGGHTIPFMGYTEQRPSTELYTLRRSTRDQAFRLPFRGADIMPGYFATLGVPLLAGRDFNENDTIGTQPVVVISQRTADTLFPGELAVGQKLRFGINESYDPWSTVIGVVGNIRFNAGERVPGHEVYWPYRQYPGPGMRYLIRTNADPANLIPRLKQIIQKTNPEISVERVVTMPDLISESVWRRRLWGAMLSVFAGLALLLAAVGLYGVMSHIVAQQQKEIGIRLAIGAEPASILRWVLRRGMLLAGTGVAIGLVLALASSSYLGTLLFGISGQDPIAYLTVAGTLLLVAFIACAIPAFRATRIDPVIALRQE